MKFVPSIDEPTFVVKSIVAHESHGRVLDTGPTKVAGSGVKTCQTVRRVYRYALVISTVYRTMNGRKGYKFGLDGVNTSSLRHLFVTVRKTRPDNFTLERHI